ncbi:hypothetical protein U1Q18_046299 [Sarracenia purpurea var. burkii]
MVMAVAQLHRESSGGSINKHLDAKKYVRYTIEQVEALERDYTECPKPSSLRKGCMDMFIWLEEALALLRPNFVVSVGAMILKPNFDLAVSSEISVDPLEVHAG